MIGTPIANRSYGVRCRAALGLDGSKTRPHTEPIHSSLFPQVAAGQIDEYIFKAGLSRSEVQKLRALFFDCIEQCGNSQMRLTHREADQTVVMRDRVPWWVRPEKESLDFPPAP